MRKATFSSLVRDSGATYRSLVRPLRTSALTSSIACLVSDEFIKICTAVTACRTSSDESILHVVSGTPAEYDYIDGDNPGLTEYIYELDIGRTKLYYIPTQSGIIEWLDFSDTVHTLSLEAGVIYLFELDPDTGTFSVRCKEPNEV